jgi:hypothetical protein
MRDELGINYPVEYDYYRDAMQLELVYPLENICIISQKAIKIKTKNGLLHADGESAIEYKDGFCVYALNGIRVSKALAETPAEKLDCKIMLTEKNAEIRREIVRKIGINRIVMKLGAKSIDKKGEYELLNFDVIDGTYRPYLRMRNPSIDAIHVEGVHPDCKTVNQALAWRNTGRTDIDYETPVILT